MQRGQHITHRHMREKWWFSGFLSLAVFAGVSCSESSQPANPARSGADSPTQQVFAVKGTVKGLKPAEKVITIEHEKIPNYMDAMTMDFEVKSTNELAGLNV